MSLLPPSTNNEYSGMTIAAWALSLISVLTIVPALIHIGLPDGGAGVIGGLDLTKDRATIVSLFAWAGTTQLVWGLMLLTVSLRYRSLVPFALLLLSVERGLHIWHMWGPKSAGLKDGHAPPEAWVTLFFFPVLLMLVSASLRRRSHNPKTNMAG